MTFNLNIDLGVILANAIQGAVTGAFTAAAVLIVTRPLRTFLNRKNKDKDED